MAAGCVLDLPLFIIVFVRNDGPLDMERALHGGKLVAAGGVCDLPLFIILFGKDDGVRLGYGEALHGGELLTSGGVL